MNQLMNLEIRTPVIRVVGRVYIDLKLHRFSMENFCWISMFLWIQKDKNKSVGIFVVRLTCQQCYIFTILLEITFSFILSVNHPPPGGNFENWMDTEYVDVGGGPAQFWRWRKMT